MTDQVDVQNLSDPVHIAVQHPEPTTDPGVVDQNTRVFAVELF